MGIDFAYLNTIANDAEKEGALLAEIASQDETRIIKYDEETAHKNKIFGIAYTRAVLWLQNCGVCLSFIPNNSHSVKFLEECDPQWKTLEDFYVVNKKFKDICNHIGTDVHYSGHALWFYEATKILIKRKNKEFYDPDALIKIMEKNSMKIEQIGDMLGNIEQINDLEDILNEEN